MSIVVNSKFDAGSIEIVDITNENLVFKLRGDTNSHFAQWFYFSVTNIARKKIDIKITNLSKSAYIAGWEDYNICASFDNKNWFRIPCEFDGDNLYFTLETIKNTVYFAYFIPYSYERHMNLVAFANSSGLATHEILGKTALGHSIDLLTLGNPDNKNKIWIIARQHPGETMAEWFMEGLINKLLSPYEAVSRKLLLDSVFYLVPNMNPDGSILGNLRVNSCGINLNREWKNPSQQRSPEVFYVRKKMEEIGVDMFFDIHGDEALPYVFTSGCDENLSFSKKQNNLSLKFTNYFKLINPDYQTEVGYEKGQFKEEYLTMATNWVGDQFDCLAQTLEMPFKDNNNFKCELTGWDSQRSYILGQSILNAISCVLA